ncbi:MAG TPA: hypothetical protein VE754_02860 [Actinomycetota bacterium]|nr:hypothetical protein [Actinomycetota bacterium]
MTKSRTFKRRVRERMSKTGEKYTAARTQVSRKRDRNEAARARLASTEGRPPDEKLRAATGKRWAQWFSILDRWGARQKKHGEIARYLMEERDVPGWWSQTVTVWYERARGMRLKHQQPDGFAVSASKTIGVPVDVLFDAFTNARKRRKWLTDGSLRLRTSQANRTARFDWDDGSTRLVVSFAVKGPSKTVVVLSHEKLPDPDEAETMKAMWRERLADLKSFVEA